MLSWILGGLCTFLFVVFILFATTIGELLRGKTPKLVPMHKVKDGMYVGLRGVISHQYAFESPVSGRKCVCYALFISQRDRQTGERTTGHPDGGQDFIIVDDRGNQALVTVDGADIMDDLASGDDNEALQFVDSKPASTMKPCAHLALPSLNVCFSLASGRASMASRFGKMCPLKRTFLAVEKPMENACELSRQMTGV